VVYEHFSSNEWLNRVEIINILRYYESVILINYREGSLIRIYFVIALIILAFFALRKFQKTPPEVIAKVIKKVALLAFVMIILVLAATGRLNWLFALVGLFMAFLVRLLPVIIRYVPQLHGLWRAFNQNKSQSSKGPMNQSGKMTKQEAREVLGVLVSATDKEIINAHRLLIQKMHPDRGGSDYLASKINQAKKVLLEK